MLSMKYFASVRFIALLLCACGFLISLPLLAQVPAKPFEYRTPQGVSFIVTEDGLSSIRLGTREIAHGYWHMNNAEWFFKIGTQKVQTAKITEKTLTVVATDHVRVRHVQQDAVTTYDYSFSGDDVGITARVENNHVTDDMQAAQFSGLTFTFNQPPTGLMPVQHYTYFQAHGIMLCHPSFWDPIGGSYAQDDAIGIGVSPWKPGMQRSLILWDYSDWNLQEKDTKRNLTYTVVAPVPAGGARSYSLKIRVSTNRDWKYLLEPYREYFQATYGPVQYKADNRWIATAYANRNQESISPENPYGFHPGAMRIDTAAGVKAFCDNFIPAISQKNGQGIIMWGQGGDDPRGAMYRPDFDVLPPEVEKNWPTMADAFKQANLRLGVATRPRDMAVRASWKSDTIISINPDDPSHQAMIWNRFKKMINLGCTFFYLDSFGDSYEDVKLMQFLRPKLGPDIQTFAEHQCDALMPYSGGYSETTFTADKDGKDGHYGLWSNMRYWEIYQWLVPGSQMASRLFQINGTISPTTESPERFFFRNHISPLLPDGTAYDKNLKALEAEYIDAQGKWVK